MSKHFEFVKTVKESKNILDEQSWLKKQISIKVKGEKWKNFPATTIPEPENFNLYDKLKDFKVYSDDLFLCGYMRSGNTMMQEMIWLMVNDFDFYTAKSVIRGKRFPYFE